MITEKDLTQNGFIDIGDGVYQKEVNDRYVNCYKNPSGGGYWVCEIEPIKEPAKNDRIATIPQLENFIEMTCHSSVKSAHLKVKKTK